MPVTASTVRCFFVGGSRAALAAIVPRICDKGKAIDNQSIMQHDDLPYGEMITITNIVNGHHSSR
jgi:hypothetical protein